MRLFLSVLILSLIVSYASGFDGGSSIIYMPDTDVMGTLGDGVFEVGSNGIVNNNHKLKPSGMVNIGFLNRMELGLTVRGKNYVSGNAKVLLLEEYGMKPSVAAGIMDIATSPNVGRGIFVDYTDSLATNPTNSAGYVVVSKYADPVANVYVGYTSRTLGNAKTVKKMGGLYAGVTRRIWKIRLMGEVGSKGINLGMGFNIWWIRAQMAMTQLQNMGSNVPGQSPYFLASLSITNMEIKREEMERLKRLAEEKYWKQLNKRPPVAPPLPFRPFMGHPGGPFGATTSIVTVPNTITIPQYNLMASTSSLIGFNGKYFGSSLNLGYGILSFLEAGVSVINSTFNDTTHVYYQAQFKATVLNEHQNYPAVALGMENITWQKNFDPTREAGRFSGETWYENRDKSFTDRSFSPYLVCSKHFGFGLTAYLGAGARSFAGYGRTTHKFQGTFFGMEKDFGPITMSGELGGRDFNTSISYRYKRFRASLAILEAQHVVLINQHWTPYYGVGVSYLFPLKKTGPLE